MKLIENDHYTYRVTWSDDDKEYVGLCAEFPGLSWLDASPEDALKGIRKVVADVIKDMNTSGETIPDPIASKRYSGKFIVRVPPELQLCDMIHKYFTPGRSNYGSHHRIFLQSRRPPGCR